MGFLDSNGLKYLVQKLKGISEKEYILLEMQQTPIQANTPIYLSGKTSPGGTFVAENGFVTVHGASAVEIVFYMMYGKTERENNAFFPYVNGKRYSRGSRNVKLSTSGGVLACPPIIVPVNEGDVIAVGFSGGPIASLIIYMSIKQIA